MGIGLQQTYLAISYGYPRRGANRHGWVDVIKSSLRTYAFHCAAVLLGGTIIVSPAMAQTIGQLGGSNIPSGSPLGGNQSNNNNNDNNNRRQGSTVPVIDPTGGGISIAPATVIDDNRNLTNIDRSVQESLLAPSEKLKRAASPNEFEDYVARTLGRRLPRFGNELMLPGNRDFATPASAAVPPDYILNVGDVISIAMTGSIEGSVEREIDTDGKVFLPKIGAVTLAGIRYADLKQRVSAAIGRQYRGYTVTVGIRRLRGIRVYVTGFANNPGAFTVSSLSTMANAVLSAGGPNSGGSFRSVKLYRHGAEVADFDLYQLVRGGDRLNDAVLQNEDVLFIPPAGAQIAVFGSVNEEAIYEAKLGETLEQMLQLAGGTNSLGDAGRIILYRSADENRIGPQQIDRQTAQSASVMGGDILQLLSRGTLVQPVARQSVLVRLEGEVNRPGNYYVRPNTPMAEVLSLAGGLSPRAFAFGTKLVRVSVREQQRESYQEAIKQLELSLSASPLTADQTQSAGERATQLAGAKEVLDRLRRAEPDGRVVMDIPPNATTLPGSVLLENNDQIYVPPRATTVGVFGAVYRPASFLLNSGQQLRVEQYVDRAGGPLRAADRKGIFVVRANGEVLPQRRGALRAYVLPGDVVFVPVKSQSGGFWSKFKEITTVLFQLGLSAATVASVVK